MSGQLILLKGEFGEIRIDPGLFENNFHDLSMVLFGKRNEGMRIMKNKIIVGLLIMLLSGWIGSTQSFAYSKEEVSEVYPLKGPKKMKKGLFKRKKRYKNNTVIKIKRSGKGPNKGRRNYSNNFR